MFAVTDQKPTAVANPFARPEGRRVWVTGVRAAGLWGLSEGVLVVWAVVVHLASPGAAAFFAGRDWFFTLFFHWDSSYFAGIARDGYFGSSSLRTWPAFFPGYPLTVRFATSLAGLSHPTSAQITVAMGVVAIVGSLVATLAFSRLVEEKYGPRAALAATALFVAGPYAIFLHASYSEALFLAFAIGAWLFANRGNWAGAGLLAAGASLTRVNGVFLVAAIVLLYVLQRKRSQKPYLARALGMAALGMAGCLAYFVYLFVKTGDLLAWQHAEYLGWRRQFEAPWSTFMATFDEVIHPSNWSDLVQAVAEILFAAIFILASVVLLRRRMWPEAILVCLTVVSLMTSSSYISLARTSVVLFPLPILVTSALFSHRRRWVYWVVLVAGAGLLLFNTRQFTLGLWTD